MKRHHAAALFAKSMLERVEGTPRGELSREFEILESVLRSTFLLLKAASDVIDHKELVWSEEPPTEYDAGYCKAVENMAEICQKQVDFYITQTIGEKFYEIFPDVRVCN